MVLDCSSTVEWGTTLLGTPDRIPRIPPRRWNTATSSQDIVEPPLDKVTFALITLPPRTR